MAKGDKHWVTDFSELGIPTKEYDNEGNQTGGIVPNTWSFGFVLNGDLKSFKAGRENLMGVDAVQLFEGEYNGKPFYKFLKPRTNAVVHKRVDADMLKALNIDVDEA